MHSFSLSLSLLLFFISVSLCSSTGDLTLYMLNDHPQGSYCLDGSPYGYYYRPGKESTKWLIFHHGGGWCYDVSLFHNLSLKVEDCWARSFTTLGTSTKWPTTTAPYPGIMNQDPAKNPLMYNWNVVWMWYCDGSSFSGFRADPVTYNSSRLFFRGKGNLDATFVDLMKTKGLDRATDVVISGGSAGGLATYLHLDYYRSLFPASVVVKGIADAGWFLDTDSYYGHSIYTPEMKNGFELWNSTGGVNSGCIAANEATNSTWKCIFAEYTYPHIKAPIFMVNSKYDSWQMANIEKLPCASSVSKCNTTELHDLLNYGKTFVGTLGPINENSKDGVFVDSCYIHTQCASTTWYTIEVQAENGKNFTASSAFYSWYNGASVKIIEACDYPCNLTC